MSLTSSLFFLLYLCCFDIRTQWVPKCSKSDYEWNPVKFVAAGFECYSAISPLHQEEHIQMVRHVLPLPITYKVLQDRLDFEIDNKSV
jgi:hypothetical protein